MAMVIATIGTWLQAQMEREDGQGLAEYGLILALIAVACLVALGLLGTNIASELSTVAGNL